MTVTLWVIGILVGLFCTYGLVSIQISIYEWVNRWTYHRMSHAVDLAYCLFWAIGLFQLLFGERDTTFGPAQPFFDALAFVSGVVFTVFVPFSVWYWIKCEWNRRKKRKVLKLIGAKARALRARLVASMPTRSPGLSPAFRVTE